MQTLELETINTTTVHSIGPYEYWYCRQTKTWWGMKVGPRGTQDGHAFHAFTRSEIELEIRDRVAQ